MRHDEPGGGRSDIVGAPGHLGKDAALEGGDPLGVLVHEVECRVGRHLCGRAPTEEEGEDEDDESTGIAEQRHEREKRTDGELEDLRRLASVVGRRTRPPLRQAA